MFAVLLSFAAVNPSPSDVCTEASCYGSICEAGVEGGGWAQCDPNAKPDWRAGIVYRFRVPRHARRLRPHVRQQVGIPGYARCVVTKRRIGPRRAIVSVTADPGMTCNLLRVRLSYHRHHHHSIVAPSGANTW